MAVPLALKVVVVGQGFAGLPLAMRAVEVGHDVVGFDLDEGRVKRLLCGESSVRQVCSATVSAALATGRYRPSSEPEDCAGFDVAVITVPTLRHEGALDWSRVESMAATLAGYLRTGATVVMESTTYPGTTELLGSILEDGSGLAVGRDFHLGYSPQRVDPGNPEWTLVNTPRIVSGVDDASLAAITAFYQGMVDEVVPVSGTGVAELAKLLETAFRHVNIALVNEFAMFAGAQGVDIWESVDAASTKPTGFLPFRPGPGVGGESLPIAPKSSPIGHRLRARAFRLIELANDVNDQMPHYIVSRLTRTMNRQRRPISRSRILLLGLAYERNTHDDRGSPALVIAERLAQLGADVRAADPHVIDSSVDVRVRRVEATSDELRAADLVVLLTDHDAFDLGVVTTNARLLFDTRQRAGPAPNVEFL